MPSPMPQIVSVPNISFMSLRVGNTENNCKYIHTISHFPKTFTNCRNLMLNSMQINTFVRPINTLELTLDDDYWEEIGSMNFTLCN